MKKAPKITVLIFYIALFVALFFLMDQLLASNNTANLEYSDVKELFVTEKVESFTTKDGVLTMKLRAAAPNQPQEIIEYDLPSFSVFYTDLNDLIVAQHEKGIITSFDYQPDSEESWFLVMLPYLLMLIICGAFLLVITRRAGGGASAAKFTKANARPSVKQQKASFSDVAGAEEEKAELREIVDFLSDPSKYTRMGAKIPKGILLVGPPGTGKTLLARAVAGEANAEFLSISGSDFVELYVGVGASRVRDLFEQAKKVAPAIIFIDEIDAVGRRRGAGMGGGHDEREQTLNQLLVEMDGFTKNEGVIIMAATNRADILDPALLRSGRFDRQIYVGRPDREGREAILRIHAKNKPLADTVDLTVVARSTEGFTGADLSNLMNEAALMAARANAPVITMPILEEAVMKVLAGPEKKSHKVTDFDRHITAIHEAGHAVAMYYLPKHEPVHRITIVPRGHAAGMTISLPTGDHQHLTKGQMEQQIIAGLGGRVAEQICLDDICTGASNDIERTTEIARDMVMKYGMSSRIGAISYGSEGEVFIGRDYEKTKSYSERTAGELDQEVKTIMDRAYSDCTALLTAHKDQIEAIAAYLERHDSMDRAQFEAAMEGREIPADQGSIFDSFRDESAEDGEQNN